MAKKKTIDIKNAIEAQGYPKIAVCTTFPAEQFHICAAEMLASFHVYWPKEVKIYIQLDEMPKEAFDRLNNDIINVVGEDRSFISGAWEDDQKKFHARWKEHKPRSYLDDIVKFSHKVFALEKCATAIKDDVDILIWLDADVITKQPIDYEWLKTVLPERDDIVSYLGRDTLHSECGWVAYNLKAGGLELLQKMKNEYTLGNFKDYTKGATDCHVLDFCLKGKKTKNLCAYYKYGVDDIHVWPKTKLAEKMTHRKGNRKNVAADNRNDKPMHQQQGNIVDSSNMKIKTRNCLDHAKICENVQTNLGQIRAWATLCKAQPDGVIVMCAAGPSLSDHIEEIKELQARGAKVVAVKHAINTLNLHGIKPWAVVLLDPRGHVEGFVKNPDLEPIYFVSSMCDPSVVKTLNDNRATVIGYHAFVGAGESKLLISADLPVSGGSATSTRSIGLFSDMLGYKKFKLFGYDLCYHQKPDMTEKNENGEPKYMELSIGTQTYKLKNISRTFFTEGQFLAQSNELQGLYKDRKDLEIEIYGDGLAAWLYRHYRLYRKYQVEYNERLESARSGAPTIDEYVEAISSGVKLARKT